MTSKQDIIQSALSKVAVPHGIREALEGLLDEGSLWIDYKDTSQIKTGLAIIDEALSRKTFFPVTNDVSDPMGFVTTSMPIPYKRALMNLRKSEICLWAMMGSPSRQGVQFYELMSLFLEYRDLYLGSEGLDLKAIEQRFQESEAYYSSLLEAAKASGLDVYPPIEADDNTD